MATQYTAGLSAGQVLTAATMNSIGAVPEAYTPVWTATTTNPAIGNGSISGEYFRIQKLVVGSIFILCGSTTTYGSGDYRFSVPITATGDFVSPVYGQILDASAGYPAYVGMGIWVTTTTFEFRTHGATVAKATTPITLATSDQLRFTFIYEAA